MKSHADALAELAKDFPWVVDTCSLTRSSNSVPLTRLTMSAVELNRLVTLAATEHAANKENAAARALLEDTVMLGAKALKQREDEAVTLTTQLWHLESRVEKLQAALEFYGREDNYSLLDRADSIIQGDRGEAARKVLWGSDALAKEQPRED